MNLISVLKAAMPGSETMEEIKGFVIFCNDGTVLTTEDNDEMQEFIKKPTKAVRFFSDPSAILDSLKYLESEVEDLESDER